MRVTFDVQHLYYLPQYQPIWRALAQAGAHGELVVYADAEIEEILPSVLAGLELDHVLVRSADEALAHYRETHPDWIVFGNGFALLDQLPDSTRTALVNHGAGVKAGGYGEQYNRMDVRFVEGAHHLAALRTDYPDKAFVLTGFAKLDPLINGEQPGLDLARLGLDPDKPSVLYAPTFYPSSIENMPTDFARDLGEFNILVKPHYFTYTKQRYGVQRELIRGWSDQPNVYIAPVEDYSLLPYLASANVLVSDASTTLFEAAALDIPIVWCDFVKLRWNYRGVFSYRYRRRMDPRMLKYYDIAEHVANPADLTRAIRAQHESPEQYAEKRRNYAEQLLGPCDGHAGSRIADYLIGMLQQDDTRLSGSQCG